MFNLSGGNAGWQILMLLVVLCGLILLNEFARRTKFGGVTMFLVIPAILTIYFIVIAIAAGQGAEWALNNQTYKYMNGWFHYAKLYAATIGCIGFMMIKYKWSIGKTQWFRAYPFVIVAINILIAVCSDFESAIKGWYTWWESSEHVMLIGGWHNIFNGVAGLINIFCMTAWWKVYSSKDKKDMIWADMTWVYILAYDVWNFAYTYNCLPTHAWYCGIALLLAPTIAALLWNRGGWIQNRANTLAIWCMFAQVWPLFQEVFTDGSSVTKWATYSSQYANWDLIKAGSTQGANVVPMTIWSAAALIINLVSIIAIIVISKKRHINPYKENVFVNQKYFKDAIARAEVDD
ncbi:MAG: DUF5692 family protein [Lachnospiraceae bacterium]|nr:DUF5692 family protein [Lachnospiraceae bacterium]